MANQNLSNTVNFKNHSVDEMKNIALSLDTTVIKAIGHNKMVGDTEEKIFIESLADVTLGTSVDQADYTYQNYKPKTSITNFPHTVQRGVKVSGSTQASKTYGVTNQLNREVFLQMRAMQQLKETYITGFQSKVEGDSVSIPNVLGGLGSVINQNIEAGAAATEGTGDYATTRVSDVTLAPLVKADFLSVQKQIIEQGGNAKDAFMGTNLFAKVGTFTGQEVRNAQVSENTVTDRVEHIQGQFGLISCKWSTFMPTDCVYLLDTSMVNVTYKRPLQEKMIDPDGDYVAKSLLEEYTLTVKAPLSCGAIYDREA